jgi:hypothetical protein
MEVTLDNLPALRALHLQGTAEQIQIATCLTALTSLTIITEERGMENLSTRIATNNPGLDSFTWTKSWEQYQSHPPAAYLSTVLTGCTALRTLVLHGHTIRDDGVTVLLTHGNNITDLVLSHTALTIDNAHRPCSWRKLTIDGKLHELAYLPLNPVQELLQRRCQRSDGQQVLECFNELPATQLAQLLHQACANLASCPALLRRPPSEVLVQGHVPWDTPAAQHTQVLQALTPLGAWNISKLALHVGGMELGRAEAEAITHTFSSSLTSLQLGDGRVCGSFWACLEQKLPRLQEVILDRCLHTDAMDVAAYLAMTCCNATRSCAMHIHTGHEYSKRLQDAITAWSLSNVTLTVHLTDKDRAVTDIF